MNVGKGAMRLKTRGLRGVLNDGQPPVRDTVQMQRVGRGEFSPGAAIIA